MTVGAGSGPGGGWEQRRRRCRVRAAAAVAALPAMGSLLVAGCSTGAQPSPATSPARVAAPDARPRAPELPPGLRQRVADLRAEAAAAPTDPTNVFRRADVIWEWNNALALAGLAVPPDLPLTIGMIRLAEADGGTIEPVPQIEMPLPLQIRRLDRYIEELGLLQDGIGVGTLRFETPGPFVSRDWTTLVETYVVGDLPVRPGGAFLLGVAGTGQEGRVQLDDPTAPAFVTARASRPGVGFEPIEARWNGVHASIGAVVDLPGFRVTGGALEPGDTVTFTYGDRSRGSQGLRVPTYSTDRWLLPIYVDPDGSDDFFGLDWPAVAIVGRPEVTLVRLLGPSVVGRDEPFSVSIRTEDDAYNRTSGPTPAYELLLGARVLATVPAGAGPFTVVDDLRIAEPGVHRLEVRSADGRLRATGNPLRVEESPRQRILWGDTHGHTGLAEGQGSPRAFFDYATHDARLDFVTLSEHDMWMDDGEWRELQELTGEYTRPGRFVGILGYEWSAFRNRGGHHNVFLREPTRDRVGVQIATRLPDLYRELRARYDPDQVLVIPHAHRAGDWTQSDPELERLLELYSVHGSFEWFANRYLENGFELGFVAAGDDHMAKPGLQPPPLSSVAQPGGIAAVYAPEASPDAVFDALRELRSYATSGQRMLIDADLNGHAMGTRQPPSPRRELRVAVNGTSPIDRIDVVRNGEVIHSRSYLTAPLARRSVLQVSFESSSEVLGGSDNPRGVRPWRGTLEIEGATVTAVRRTGLDNPLRDRMEWAPETPQRVRFQILTRGRADSILLELENAGAQTRLRFELEATRETGAASTLRPLHDIPAAEVTLALADLERGRLAHAMPPVGEHVDHIQLQLVDDTAPLDRELVYTDLDSDASGDYYYVRVTQLDGGRAWTSPWWVGGRSPGRRMAVPRPAAGATQGAGR